MTVVTHDSLLPEPPARAVHDPRRTSVGLIFALLSAASFGMSGALARGSLETGWSPGALVLVRVGVAALLLLPFGLYAARGRWALLRHNLRRIAVFGLMAVAVAQFCFFSAVQTMQVGPALLIEYTAPAAVVLWLWLRHGERPGRLTLAGAGLAALGLVLVLDLVSGAELSVPGVLWALGAMAGCATYFLMSADTDTALPPLTLAAGGLVAGSLGLAALGGVGLLPMRAATTEVALAGQQVDWWVPMVLLAVFTAAIAYSSGIAATRRLGSRLASFVALLEVVMGVVFAWVLLDELPGPVQLAGGVLVLAGVVAVKLGEHHPTGYRGDRGDDDAFDPTDGPDGLARPAAA
jgi:drug/metabolite transporter (DMT)-like permease